MLHLASDTEPRWAAAAAQDIPSLLIDHAHCEKKAASTSLNLLFRYPDLAWLQRPLSAICHEEIEHFQLMLDVMAERNIAFCKQTPSLYAGRLMKVVRPNDPERLVDTLLCCALIEARSCERMKLLSETLPDEALRALYAGLLASEARHFQVYIDLATLASSREIARARLAELAAHEAAVLTQPGDGLRMHSDA